MRETVSGDLPSEPPSSPGEKAVVGLNAEAQGRKLSADNDIRCFQEGDDALDGHVQRDLDLVECSIPGGIGVDMASMELSEGGAGTGKGPGYVHQENPRNFSMREKLENKYGALYPFVIISITYLLFTITDGAVRMIVLLHGMLCCVNVNVQADMIAIHEKFVLVFACCSVSK